MSDLQMGSSKHSKSSKTAINQADTPNPSERSVEDNTIRPDATSQPPPTTETPVKRPSLVRRYKNHDAWLWTEVAAIVAGLFFFIPTGYSLWIDLDDRKTQRVAQAWELVTRVAPGNSGKVPALEFLNEQGIILRGINLSSENNQNSTYLDGLNLSGAHLRDANMSGAFLREANLSKANFLNANMSEALLYRANLSEATLATTNLSKAILISADLSGANLYGADLSGADLHKADLSGAILRVANFSGAGLDYANLSGAHLRAANLSGTILRGANLSGAVLIDAKNLDQSMLDEACGNEETLLPKGFTIPICQN